MRVVLDIETDGLRPTCIWVIVVKDIDTGKLFTFLAPFDEFREQAKQYTQIVGHNILGYDIPNINRLLGMNLSYDLAIDTLIISRLLNYEVEGGHSLEAWGKRLGYPKGDFKDWSNLSDEMILYCQGDVELSYRIFKKFERYINEERWAKALRTEHDIAVICDEMHTNGFYFNLERAKELHKEITAELETLDANILTGFQPKLVDTGRHSIRFRKDGRPWAALERLYPSNAGCTTVGFGELCSFEAVPFNPASPRQIVQRLNSAGWKPVEKTKGYLQAERDLKQCRDPAERLKLKERLEEYAVHGWKVSEENLETLPDTAPEAAKSLARRILLASRLSSLNEWIRACREDHRVHGTIFPIGAWTQRMSHADPNTANIPSEHNRKGQVSLYGKEFRSLWTVPKGRRLVGVDAEGIQLRILAHYINDPTFTHGLISGKKELGTDIHTMNKKALGEACKSRDVAKIFIYSWLLGAGEAKTAEVLSCSTSVARTARQNFLEFYPGLKYLKEEQIPRDAKRGFFEGIDGRYVVCDSEHLMLAGYLQNGESIVMKMANILWRAELRKEKIPFWQVNFVHDEWQTETIDDDEVAEHVAAVQIKSIVTVGEMLNLRCALSGSKGIGYTWYDTH